MNVVIDTSAFISALLASEGASRVILRLCLQKHYRPIMGAALFAEYEEIMGRERLFASCPITPSERMALFEAFMSVCRWTNIYFGWRPNLRDEGDNHLIELALAGGASMIVTHNVKDLASTELKFPQLLILTPAQLLRRYPTWEH